MLWMKKFVYLFMTLIPVLAFGQTISEIEDNDYKEAIANYFEQDIAVVNSFIDKKITLEELPAIFFIAKKTKLSPEQIAVSNQSWQEIIKSNNSNLDMFYFSIISGFKSNTYLPIFNKFKAFNAKAVEPTTLSKKEIINLVNLQFIMKLYDHSAFEIMAMRDYGKRFARINADVKLIKENLHKKDILKRRKAAKEKQETEE